MTLSELFERFRIDVDDVETPYLWTTADLESYFNWALEQLAKRAMYFYDTSTWTGSNALTITADDPKITASSSNHLGRILNIRRATLGSDNRTLSIRTMAQANEVVRPDDYGQHLSLSTSWETNSGTPGLLVTNYYADKSLRLGPTPSVADTLSLWAYRLPLDYITLERGKDAKLESLLGISEYSHELTLVQGMKARAYLKEDPETRDTQLADTAEVRFVQEVLEIKRDLERQRHPVGTVVYGGIR